MESVILGYNVASMKNRFPTSPTKVVSVFETSGT